MVEWSELAERSNKILKLDVLFRLLIPVMEPRFVREITKPCSQPMLRCLRKI